MDTHVLPRKQNYFKFCRYSVPMQKVILTVTNTKTKGVPVSGSVTYALVITVERNMVYKFSKTRTVRLYTIYGHLVKLSKRAFINGEAPYVNSSYRCEFFILKFLCALW
jgi:hypothetical protein